MNWLSGAASSFGNLFDVGSTVSSSTNINPDDVVKTKSALNAVGNYEIPSFGITDIPDNQMIDGLKSFQQENGLKVDGVMKPSGPTATTLGQTLANKGVTNTDLIETAKKVTPKPKTKVDPLTGLPDPLAKPVKGKMPTAKQWEKVAKLQNQKPKTAIIPKGKSVQQRIQSMMTDKRYGDQHDTRLRDHVTKQFERAFSGTLQYDETGKMVQPVTAISPDQVEPFDPDGELNASNQNNTPELSINQETTGKGKIKDLFSFESSVGSTEENKPDDLRKVKKMLTLFGHADPNTPDNDPQALDTSIKRFQVANGLKVDGILKPDGETAKAMQGKIKNLAKQYAKAKGASAPDDQDEDEWLDDEMNREDDTSLWEDFLNWLSSLFSPERIPDGPIINPPRG
ncbi:peptidoglycan-binding domain-containing protein [Terasakiella pusilla]|uniref:peptidoglycan-binding domain-containing protein n=1 Tax=Terasakiella pusilla TaxID=64973 RepID=UPI00068F9100|nr:peptidoglycan-binding domain-containing protein [Terasakiella pusilla]